jgi:hypothetical protein
MNARATRPSLGSTRVPPGGTGRRCARPAGTFSNPPLELSDDGAAPAVAINAAGDVFLARRDYRAGDGGFAVRARGAKLPAGAASVSASKIVSPLADENEAPQVAVDDAGDAVTVWCPVGVFTGVRPDGSLLSDDFEVLAGRLRYGASTYARSRSGSSSSHRSTRRASSATVLALIDIVHVAKGRIAPTYLADAGTEVGLIAALAFSHRRRNAGARRLRRLATALRVGLTSSLAPSPCSLPPSPVGLTRTPGCGAVTATCWRSG